jgi:hypothetical protein
MSADPRDAAMLVPMSDYFSQLSYVVADLDAAVSDFGRSFGVGFTRAKGEADPARVRYLGKPTNVSLGMAFADLRGIELEIIQPLNEHNLYTDFLEQHGPGLHHVGFKIPEHSLYRHYYDLLSANGSVPLMEGTFEGSIRVEFCYFDCSAFGAQVIELSHRY